VSEVKDPLVAADRVKSRLAELGGRLFVGGEFVAATSGRRVEVVDPSVGAHYASQAIAGDDDVRRAVDAADAASAAWAAASLEDRSACFARLAERIEASADALAMADAIDAGLPVLRMHTDIRSALHAIKGWPALAFAFRGEVMPKNDILHFTKYQPYGVVARIVAYNHPFLFAVKGCLAALIAGNCIVLKTADQTPASSWLIAEMIQESFPPGVFNIVNGDAATGRALVQDRRVRRIAFTGSERVGRRIQIDAAESGVKSVSLELGGKNPMLVFADADVEEAARQVVKAMNLRANQGQSCGSMSRILVAEQVADRFRQTLATTLAGLTLGPAYDPTADMGPLISEAHRQRVNDAVAAAVADGATVVTGGPDDARAARDGFFAAPTLLDGIPDGHRILTTEIFGPVMTLQRFADPADMVATANAVDYGLTASVWTSDLRTALRTSDAIEAGYVWVNDSTTHHWGMPFGGWKASGIGREESIAEYLSYLQPKSIHISY
jgi:acyl-CoA reductase-like NAD-dependent aldehyde dehydrogenase